jgi:nucleoside-diphosphate-sugar epimerase
MATAILFGGAGFIATHFTNHLLDRGFDEILLVDIVKNVRSEFIYDDKRVKQLLLDVRNPIIDSFSDLLNLFKFEVDLIVNFAAIHREPGHLDREYFETNLLGAQNICDFAEIVGCQNIIFTSSISPYGISEALKNEDSLPIPVTPYGSSKLVAEKIHLIWQAKESKRCLVIVRPGVVFGPGEGGNVSRLIKAVIHRYFFYMGNRDTRKAGVYVKELCNAIWWVFSSQEKHGEKVSLFNISMNPSPSIEQYVNAVCKVAGVRRYIPSVPFKFLLAVAYTIDFFSKPFGVKHPFSPVRIRKLVRSNNIIPKYLADHGYQYQYSLVSAFDDWKKSAPEEWK